MKEIALLAIKKMKLMITNYVLSAIEINCFQDIDNQSVNLKCQVFQTLFGSALPVISATINKTILTCVLDVVKEETGFVSIVILQTVMNWQFVKHVREEKDHRLKNTVQHVKLKMLREITQYAIHVQLNLL